MGFPYFGIMFPKFIPLSMYNFLYTPTTLVKHIIHKLLLPPFPLLNGTYFSQPNDNSAVECRPSPLLVPIPAYLVAGSIKKRLPIVEYRSFLERKGGFCVCVVCLRCMEESDEVRELPNCCHVFHRECVDAWIDEGQISCPLCRSNLSGDEGDKFGGDQWRKERMIYLFGEDYIMLVTS